MQFRRSLWLVAARRMCVAAPKGRIEWLRQLHREIAPDIADISRMIDLLAADLTTSAPPPTILACHVVETRSGGTCRRSCRRGGRPAVPKDIGADLHQTVAQGGHGPLLDLLGQRQGA